MWCCRSIRRRSASRSRRSRSCSRSIASSASSATAGSRPRALGFSVILSFVSGPIADRFRGSRLLAALRARIAAGLGAIAAGYVYTGAVLLFVARALFAIVSPVIAAQQSTDRIGAIAAYATWSDCGLAAGVFIGIMAVDGPAIRRSTVCWRPRRCAPSSRSACADQLRRQPLGRSAPLSPRGWTYRWRHGGPGGRRRSGRRREACWSSLRLFDQSSHRLTACGQQRERACHSEWTQTRAQQRQRHQILVADDLDVRDLGAISSRSPSRLVHTRQRIECDAAVDEREHILGLDRRAPAPEWADRRRGPRIAGRAP